ncbi:undecaprenyl-phosphate 4-deoxy-4-formamido-L-arabinose transferase [Eubacterium ruminantium]|uniref:Undecaprenyl-phosphate 4-deoxy-4-formamido-L-arabinose transferase n=1 Tax=Eubacterium ruminantium TaxID=42322 RepID=A0A1T4NJ07_9FIRM|nr:glycosyltransferase [Eubacterium ruminantium]SCW53793.1 undecaprenyl-phosphate 4-deoxy-4-formamido-L-arabinose transferase [Eubacterium ruminantium]SDM88027.1 undecaprenyl-phosphate 4-deoxy-4-formamido-L-arabinose transferase [Eubacterium ruminantium]SJZ79027.1 undecaprenyl-phosphate 4-deoxy-4-formamido-L-arabinose transferase [Eubacterium ruminantium]
MKKENLISFVIPCYRSEKTVSNVIKEIIDTVSKQDKYDYEIVAVNDCSPDNVISVLKDLASTNKKIKVIDCSINKGKHAAVLAGYRYVSGSLVCNVDDDGQCPVDHVFELVEQVENGYDMAMAQYKVKKEGLIKRFGSAVNNKMSVWLLDKPKDFKFSNFIVRKRFVCDAMTQYNQPFPYLEGISLSVTRNIAMVPMEERNRAAGRSGYTFKKSLGIWMNGFTAFSVKPLRLASLMGIFIAFIGLLYGLYVIIRKIVDPSVFAGYSSIMAAILFIGGVIMVLLGILGEYVGRIYVGQSSPGQSIIRETYNIENENKE